MKEKVRPWFSKVLERGGRTVAQGTPPVPEAEVRVQTLLARPDAGLDLVQALVELSRAHLACGQLVEARGPAVEAGRLYLRHARVHVLEKEVREGWQTKLGWLYAQLEMSQGALPLTSSSWPLLGTPGSGDRSGEAFGGWCITTCYICGLFLCLGDFDPRPAVLLAEQVVDVMAVDTPGHAVLRIMKKVERFVTPVCHGKPPPLDLIALEGP